MHRTYNRIAFCLLGLYTVFCVVTFYTSIKPSESGASDWKMYADADTYLGTARQLTANGPPQLEDFVGLLAFSHNVIIPPLQAILLGESWEAIAVCNAALFLLTCIVLGRTFRDFKWYIFLPFILLYPDGYQSILTLCKEIFVLISAVAFAVWLVRPSKTLLAAIIALSLWLRWEQALIIILFLIVRRLNLQFKTVLILGVIVISVVYPFAVAHVRATEDWGAMAENSSSDFYMQINALQEKGFFFVLLVPKLFIAMTSQLLRPWQLLNDRRLHSMMTGVFVLIDQFWLCAITVVAWKKKLWRLSNPFIYFILMFVFITMAAPLNSPRYLFFAYVLMVIVLSSRELQTLGKKKVLVSFPDDAGAALGAARPGYDPAMARAFTTGSS